MANKDHKFESLASNLEKDGNGGEDDSSTEREGDDSHLHDDQKSRKLGDT